LEVAHLAGIIAAETGGDEILARRAGILPILVRLSLMSLLEVMSIWVLKCARDIKSRSSNQRHIRSHGHAEPTSVESAAVCAADTLSAASRELEERYLRHS